MPAGGPVRALGGGCDASGGIRRSPGPAVRGPLGRVDDFCAIKLQDVPRLFAACHVSCHSFIGEIRSFYLFEGMGSFSHPVGPRLELALFKVVGAVGAGGLADDSQEADHFGEDLAGRVLAGASRCWPFTG